MHAVICTSGVRRSWVIPAAGTDMSHSWVVVCAAATSLMSPKKNLVCRARCPGLILNNFFMTGFFPAPLAVFFILIHLISGANRRRHRPCCNDYHAWCSKIYMNRYVDVLLLKFSNEIKRNGGLNTCHEIINVCRWQGRSRLYIGSCWEFQLMLGRYGVQQLFS